MIIGDKVKFAVIGAGHIGKRHAEMIIRNDSGQTITVYPYNTSTTMNAAAASVSLATAKTMLVKATSATTWVTLTGA